MPKRREADRLFTNALRVAVNQYTTDDKGKKIKYINAIAQVMAIKAQGGDTDAAKIIADRLEGRPVARVDQNVDATLTVKWQK
jgi:hypothetical protein